MPPTTLSDPSTVLDPFALDVVVTDEPGAIYPSRGCDTSDGCASTCASSCASS